MFIDDIKSDEETQRGREESYGVIKYGCKSDSGW